MDGSSCAIRVEVETKLEHLHGLELAPIADQLFHHFAQFVRTLMRAIGSHATPTPAASIRFQVTRACVVRESTPALRRKIVVTRGSGANFAVVRVLAPDRRGRGSARRLHRRFG